jgi:hypothetical protein
MSDWPELRTTAWRDTYATLHLCSQVVGKVRLALTPKMNEWWNVPLYVTTRGLTTSPMPYRDRTVSIDFDLIDHRIIIQDSWGHVRAFALAAGSIRAFCATLFEELAAIDVDVQINPAPQECPVTTSLTDDVEHGAESAVRSTSSGARSTSPSRGSAGAARPRRHARERSNETRTTKRSAPWVSGRATPGRAVRTRRFTRTSSRHRPGFGSSNSGRTAPSSTTR